MSKFEAKYKNEGEIGSGTYGTVFRITRRTDGKLFAAKLVKRLNEGGRYNIVTSMATLREIKLLKELHHPNIVELEEVVIDAGQTMHLIYSYASYDLRHVRRFYEYRREPMPLQSIKTLFYELLKGLDFLHSNWVLHRDIKPQNILVTQEGRPQIADFGLARIFKSPLKALTDVERVVVTLWYRAPELLFGGKHYTTAVDIWSMGATFAEMITLKEIFPAKEECESDKFQWKQCERIFAVLGAPNLETWPLLREYPFFSKVSELMHAGHGIRGSRLVETLSRSVAPSDYLDPQMIDLIERMLVFDPCSRITAKEALEHPFFHSSPFPDDSGNMFAGEVHKPLVAPTVADRNTQQQTQAQQAAPAPIIKGFGQILLPSRPRRGHQ
eukprot:TRINITY_DN2226_c0_g1_i1.p1 TRINITY_DN2226_c0_g1~~TRINITY_DN2226_c0_g1_i1.p1  ORF type:complete len:384 (+),score=66.32 TRINITY_DN2226_c0_g1_i1:116-1267(+)